MRKIRSEFLKLKRLTEIRLTLLVCFLFLLFLYFQKGINRASGFYTPELLNAQYLSSFNLLLLCTFGFIPAAIIGSYVSGIDFRNNTNIYSIISSGRCQTIIIKIVTILLMLFFFILAGMLLGILEGIFFDQKLTFHYFLLTKQFICSFIVLFYYAILGLLFTTITKKIYGGILISIFLPLILEEFSFKLPILKYITFSEYSNSFVKPIFENLSNDLQIQLLVDEKYSLYTSVFICLMFIMMILLIEFLFVRKIKINA